MMHSVVLHWLLLLLPVFMFASASSEAPWYDYSAYTECKSHAEAPLYDGGVLKEDSEGVQTQYQKTEFGIYSPSFVLYNLTNSTRYAFSCWVKVRGAESVLVKARVSTDSTNLRCIGTVLAKSGCWSFLKGGFVLDSSSATSILYFEAADNNVEMSIASSSLQPFSVEQWEMHQNETIRTKRKRSVVVHVSDTHGNQIAGASVFAKQLSKDFPFGSAIAKTIIGNVPYQAWFVERFNAAVFENELKWYATEPEPGKLNYTLADKMLDFIHSNQILVRGHNIFWEDPKYTPAWVRNLPTPDLRTAVKSRINSLMSKYKGEFVHWDVSNEMLHFDFYEDRLGPNATMDFFHAAQKADPLATLFMNDFNVVETCDDVNSTVDTYVERLRELKMGGAVMEGIGLEGHFTKPNVVLMRGILDKLATLQLPIWLTEIDISNSLDHKTQAVYLEEVLREGFSHPAVNGIMLWTALHPNGCYEMCLTDINLVNLPAGDTVDKLLEEWQTGKTEGVTDDHGIYSFNAFLGEYEIHASYENRTVQTTLSLCRGDETKHLNIQIRAVN